MKSKYLLFGIIVLGIIEVLFIVGCATQSEKHVEKKVQEKTAEQKNEAISDLPEHCKDNLYNNGEEGLDCGWTCPNECNFIKKEGTLIKDEVWEGNILVNGMVEVLKGATLIIKPGAVVKFQYSQDYKNPEKGALYIKGGTLKAIGNSEKQIWFTSASLNPINDDWEGIAIEDSKEKNILDHVIVEFAFIGVRFWTSSGTLSNSIVRWINAEGIYMERSNPVIENNMIYGTGYNGIAMEQFNYDVLIKNNRIINNQGSSVHGEATKATIENNIIKNSKTGATFNDFSEITLRNNLIENIKDEGSTFTVGSSGNLYFNKIRKNGIGITSEGSKLVANNNDIYDNTINANINTMQEVDLRENWWGTTDKNEIREKIQFDTEMPLEPFLEKESVSIKELLFDYQDIKNTDLGYIPGDPKDKHPYVYADKDETRKIIKKICGEQEGFGDYTFGWSLAWDGKYLWRSRNAGAGNLIKIDPETCEVLAEFENLGIAQDRGIAFDGKSLWVNDFSAKKVFEIDPQTGKILSDFNIPEMGSGSSGLAWDGQYLYLIHWLKQKELYKIDRQGNLIGILELEQESGPSITFDGKYFWTSPCGAGICKFDKNGKKVGEIYSVAYGGEAIAHDGKYLWVLHRTQELWRDPKLFKIEVINDQILLEPPEITEVLPTTITNCSFGLPLLCSSYKINQDKVIFTVKNTGSLLTINRITQYFTDEIGTKEPDCPALSNLNLKLEKDRETTITMPCPVLKSYFGKIASMEIQLTTQDQETINGKILGTVV